MSLPSADYWELVAEHHLTCGACPLQWEGRLHDGRFFYFRYRYGWASIAVGASPDEVAGRQDRGVQVGDPLDGSMSDDEYQATFLQLMENQL